MILDTLKYSGLFTFSSSMGTDPVPTAPAFHWGEKVDREKPTVKDTFMYYELLSEKVYGIS